MDKREMSIPRQWDKTKKHGSFAWPKRKSLYPGERSSQNLSKSELARAIRNLSTQAKISLLQPELARAKKEVSEQSLLGPALGGDMDSLPDDPWFSKSPEEKYEDAIQEEHGQYEDPGSGKPFSGLSGDLEFVGEHEGEEEGALAANKFLSGSVGYDYDDPSAFGDYYKKDFKENALDRMAREKFDEDVGGDYHDIGNRTTSEFPGRPAPSFEGESDGGFAASQESGGESKGLSPMQKYGAKMITDIFSEKEERPQQSIGASPLTPGRSLDMSKYSTSRPKKERYRNMGLLGRA